MLPVCQRVFHVTFGGTRPRVGGGAIGPCVNVELCLIVDQLHTGSKGFKLESIETSIFLWLFKAQLNSCMKTMGQTPKYSGPVAHHGNRC